MEEQTLECYFTNFYATRGEFIYYFTIHKTKFFSVLENIRNIKYIVGKSNRTVAELYSNCHTMKYINFNSYHKYLEENESIPNFKLFAKQETISSLIVKEANNKYYGNQSNNSFIHIGYNDSSKLYPLEEDTTNLDIVDSCYDNNTMHILLEYNSNKGIYNYPNISNRPVYKYEINFYKKCYIINLNNGRCSCKQWKYNHTCKHKIHSIEYNKHIFRNLCLVLSKYFDFITAFEISKNFLIEHIN